MGSYRGENVVESEHRESGRGGQTFFPDRPGKRNILVVTRGHSFERDPFYAIFEDTNELEWSGVEHPAAQLMFQPVLARHFDCFVLYDMPGIEFRREGDRRPVYHSPPSFYKEGLLELLEQGFPLVVLHHACAAWPNWPEWAEIVGARFLYQPGVVRGKAMPDSGYRLNVKHRITPVCDHPITRGIAPFELVDELYLAPVFEDSIVPLFSSSFSFEETGFFSASRALEGFLNDRSGWSHPAGSPVVGWIKHYFNSPVVYLQFGDGPSAYGHPVFRQILMNAIKWATSADASEWARGRNRVNPADPA